MNLNSVLGAVLLSCATLSVSTAQMGPQTPEQQAEKAVKTRQGLFEVQGFAFGPVGAMLRGANFDAALVQKEAARVTMTAGMIPEVFMQDTRTFQVQTKARETVWTKKDEFTKKAEDLQSAASKLEAVAKTGDKTAVLNAITTVGQACKSCHDDFRDK